MHQRIMLEKFVEDLDFFEDDHTSDSESDSLISDFKRRLRG